METDFFGKGIDIKLLILCPDFCFQGCNPARCCISPEGLGYRPRLFKLDFRFSSGCSAARLAHHVRDVEVGCSNHLTPTKGLQW